MPVANMNRVICRSSLEDVETAAVYHKRRTGDEARFFGRKEADGGSDIRRLADGAGDLLGAAPDVGVVPQHRRVHGTRRDAVDTDFSVSELLAEAARERLDT